MTNASSSNVPSSDATLPTVPQKTQRYTTTDERTFLTQQAADAKTAMRRTIEDIKGSAQEAANIRWWTQQYPWYAVGAAAVVGFVAATRVLVPADHHAESAPPARAQTTAAPSFSSSLFELLRSTLMSAIVGALNSSNQPAERITPQTEDALHRPSHSV